MCLSSLNSGLSGGQGAALISVLLLPQVRHVGCSQLCLLHSLGHRVYPGCCLFLLGFVAGFASGPPSTSSQPRVQFGRQPHLSALYVSLLARVPLGEIFLPSCQLTIQACVAYGNTMELDLKKLVVTAIIIIYIVKNLG